MYIEQYYVIASPTEFNSTNPDYKAEVLAGPFPDAPDAYDWQTAHNIDKSNTRVVYTRVPVKLYP